MIYSLVVPGPIEDVEEVRVLEWHGNVGDAFEVGALIVELETHKAVVEVRAGQRGLLRDVLSAAGSWQKIGRPLAFLSDRADDAMPIDAAALDQCDVLPVEFEIT